MQFYKLAINADIIAILIIIRTVIVPLIVKLARVLELFGLNNQTSSSNDIFLLCFAILGITGGCNYCCYNLYQYTRNKLLESRC